MAAPADSRVETDGNIITGKGPGCSFEFACAIASALGSSEEEVAALKRSMFIAE
jgi:putative intracellular protease/amidase